MGNYPPNNYPPVNGLDLRAFSGTQRKLLFLLRVQYSKLSGLLGASM